MADQPTHLDPSELGTKQYWDSAYERELQNHSASATDEGTVWFSDSSAEEKVLDYLDDLAEQGLLGKVAERTRQNATSFLDLGTGNGHLLFELRARGWDGLCVGVDYSPASVQLARQIGEARGRIRSEALQARNEDDEGDEADDDDDDDDEADESSWAPVRFEEHDLLSGSEVPGRPPKGFDVLLDKGTFDAISLSSAESEDGKRICESYSARVAPLLRDAGLLVITSCNWTEQELLAWFEGESKPFVLRDRIKYPSFRFGGQTGQSVVTLCFEKRE